MSNGSAGPNPYGSPSDGENAGGSSLPEPEYGQRSDNWSNPYAPQAPTPEPGTQSTPWPVYDQGAPGSQSPQAGAGIPGQPVQPGPAAHPYMPYGQSPGATPYPAPMGAPLGEAPKRGGAITLLVSGIVVMLILAPIVFVSLILSGIGVSRIADGSMTAVNGGTISVDSSGIVGVAPLTGEAYGCVLESSQGDMITMVNESNTGIFVSRGLDSDTYTVSCDGVGPSAELLVMTGDQINDLVSSSLRALGFAAIIGITGLIMLIAGIIWLVNRNGKRKEYFRNVGYGGPRYPGPGQPGSGQSGSGQPGTF